MLSKGRYLFHLVHDYVDLRLPVILIKHLKFIIPKCIQENNLLVSALIVPNRADICRRALLTDTLL